MRQAHELAALRIPPAALPSIDLRGLYLRHVSGQTRVLFGGWEVGSARGYWPDPHRPGDSTLGPWFLDLTERATADRVAQWMASSLLMRVAATSPFFGPVGERAWSLFTGGASQVFVPDLRGRQTDTGPPAIKVPALAELNAYTDPRELPDGALYVHRLALVECAGVVATLTPVPR